MNCGITESLMSTITAFTRAVTRSYVKDVDGEGIGIGRISTTGDNVDRFKRQVAVQSRQGRFKEE